MITPNRAVALYHLRMNPNNHKQAKFALIDKNGCRCAVGLIAEAFNIPVEVDAGHDSNVNAQAYTKVENVLGLTDSKGQVNHITMINDCYDRTFDQIAELLEQCWTEETDDLLSRARTQKYSA